MTSFVIASVCEAIRKKRLVRPDCFVASLRAMTESIMLSMSVVRYYEAFITSFVIASVCEAIRKKDLYVRIALSLRSAQ